MIDKLNSVLSVSKPGALTDRLAALAASPGRRVAPASWFAHHGEVGTHQIAFRDGKPAALWSPGVRPVTNLTQGRVRLGESVREFRHLVFVASDDNTFITWDTDMNTLIIYTANA